MGRIIFTFSTTRIRGKADLVRVFLGHNGTNYLVSDLLHDARVIITFCNEWGITLLSRTFSYYIFTAQEFMLPLVERRAVQERFWKNVRKSHFDVNQFKQLRTQLIAIERRAKRVRSTPFASSIPLG